MEASCICTEAGKTIDDASSEVVRALDMIEAACSIQNDSVGHHMVNESTSTYTTHEPLVRFGIEIQEHPANTSTRVYV